MRFLLGGAPGFVDQIICSSGGENVLRMRSRSLSLSEASTCSVHDRRNPQGICIQHEALSKKAIHP